MKKIALIASDSGSGGLIKYINYFLEVKYDSDIEVTLFCGNNLRINDSKYVKIIRTNFATETGLDLLLNRPLNEEFKKMILDYAPDAVLFLNGYIRKGLENLKVYSILHNQLVVDNKLLFKQNLRLIISLLAARNAANLAFKKADGIIFLSESSKNEVDAKKIHYKKGEVINFAHSNTLKNINEKVINNNQLIYVSTGLPYKNHLRLVKALSILKERNISFHIKFIGFKNKKIKKLINKLNLNENIDVLGWLSHKETLNEIEKSSIYINASLIESTSNGVLEGVIVGNKIVCSDIGVFKEALLDNAVYFNPYSINDIADKIEFTLKHNKTLTENECNSILNRYDYEESVKKTINFILS